MIHGFEEMSHGFEECHDSWYRFQNWLGGLAMSLYMVQVKYGRAKNRLVILGPR